MLLKEFIDFAIAHIIEICVAMSLNRKQFSADLLSNQAEEGR